MTSKKLFNLQEFFYALCAMGAVIFGCITLWIVNPNFFWVDDMQSQHLPAYIDMARAIGEGSFPLITPYSWDGGRLAGELQYGIFSIFHLPLTYIICNLPISMSSMAALFCITYLVILSAGAYALGRSYKLPSYLCFLIATSLPFSGFLMLWGTKTWFPILTSFAWVPWTWAALRWTLQESSRPLSAICTGVLIYLTFAAGWPFTNLMLLLITAWLIATKAWQTKSLPKIKYFILAWIIGILLAMPTHIAFLDSMQYSTRGTEGISFARTWMVPFTALGGLILPSYETFWPEFTKLWVPRLSIELFCGIAAPAMFLFVIGRSKKEIFRKFAPEFILLGITLLLMSSPILAPLQHSFRWLPLFHLVFLLLASLLWQTYTTDVKNIAYMNVYWGGLRGAHTLCASLIGIIAAILFVRIALLHIVTTPPLRIVSFSILAILFIWILLTRFVSLQTNRWLLPIASLASLLISLMILPNPHRLPEWDVPEAIRNPQPYKKDYLYLALIDFNTVYNFYNQYPQTERALLKFGNFPLISETKFINGYSPTYPMGLWSLFLFGWSGFLPNPAIRTVAEHPEMLDFLSIDGVLVSKSSKYPVTFPPTWLRAFETPNFSLYERPTPTPLARSVPQATFVPDAIQYSVENKDSFRSQLLVESHDISSPQIQTFAQANLNSVNETRLGITADVENPDTQNPALIIFKRAWYPGYIATLNEKELPVYIANLSMTAVQIPPHSSGKLSLQFCPHSLTKAFLASSLGIFLILILTIKDIPNRTKKSR